MDVLPFEKQSIVLLVWSERILGTEDGLATGLWDLNYLRKHTYAGFAVGLGAPKYWENFCLLYTSGEGH